MRLITVTVIWRDGEKRKKVTLSSVMANPDTVTGNAILNGTVTNLATSAALQDALVNVSENQGWRDVTDASGIYGLTLSPGSYTLGVAVPGFFPSYRSFSIVANQTKTEDFALQPMSSASVVGFGRHLHDAGGHGL
jgi:hypothetical protein